MPKAKPRFRPYNHDQDTILVVNYKEQLQPGTFEHAVHYLIQHKLDLSVFYPHYRNKDTGRRAYDPAILLPVILFAYSRGITSSREIQWCCETNVIFKALSCDTVPHFTTLAKFVSSHADEIEALFEQVLLVCDEQGLLGHELFAIDGCKMSSNAAKEWSGTFKELEEKRQKLKRLIRHHLNEHHELDEAETEAELDQDIRRAKTVLSLDESLQKVDRFLKTNSPRMGQGKRRKEVKSNTCICPAGRELHYEATRTDGNGVSRAHFKGRLLQCRYCPKKHQCMQNPASADHRKGNGRQVTFALERNREPNYTDWMKHRVDSPQGKKFYSHRMSVVEPVFGNIGTNKRLNRFSLQGRKKVQGQWQLYCLVHNIEKLANYGRMAA